MAHLLRRRRRMMVDAEMELGGRKTRKISKILKERYRKYRKKDGENIERKIENRKRGRYTKNKNDK